MYLIIYYFCLFIYLFIFVTLIYVTLQQSKKKFNFKSPNSNSKNNYSINFNIFFSFNIFYIHECICLYKKKENLYTDELKFFSLIYYINCIIFLINLLLFIPINLIALSIFYEYSLGESKNSLSKTTSKTDFFFAISKIIVTVSLDGDEDIHYIVIITLNIFTFLSIGYIFLYSRFNEIILIFMNQFLSLTLWWVSFILLIGKFTRHKKFSGFMIINFVIEPIFCFIILLKKYKISIILSIISKIKNSSVDLLVHFIL